MTQKNKSVKEKRNMLGNLHSKLDKATCMVSLIVIMLVIFTIANPNVLSLVNISGIFKQ